jgi:serine/threonine protein kinase
MPEWNAKANELFLQAAEIESAPERQAFLDIACGGDADLRRLVDGLLADMERAGSFMERSVGNRGTISYRPADESVGAIIAGKYKLIQELGQGGMGAVWLARQIEPVKRNVAIKFIKPGMDSRQVLARFEAERQALAMMEHPNIAKVLDGGLTQDHRPFFVMDLVKGVPITEYCDARKLTPNERLELFVPVCQAIQHAHQKGIIHRDIKPSNVLIAMYDDKPVPKVIDFGIAKATGGTLTEETIVSRVDALIGTAQYMSPEQAKLNNLDIDTRSDIYSLGVLLYELLTGAPPITREELEKNGLLEILRVIREEEPSKPSTKLSSCDTLPSLAANRSTEPGKLTKLLRSEIDWIVMKALEKDRARRYETAYGFAADILRYLSGEPVNAHPPSAGYRFKKFLRKHRGPAITASLVFFALLVGMAGTTWGLIEARQAKKRESERAVGEHKAKVAAVEAQRNAEAAADAERLAKERESAERARAEKAYARTADVLDAMVSEVTGDSLATQKTITVEQKKFLTEVLTYYQEFAAAKADDEKTRRRTAGAAYRVGNINYRLGRKEESAAAHRRALEAFAALSAEFPADATYRRNLATCHNSLGLLLSELGKRPEAEEQYRKGLAIQEKLAVEFPAVPDCRQDLARSHNNLGNLLADLGKRPLAEEQYRKALAIQEKLAAEFPAVPDYRQELAVSHNNLGNQLTRVGKRPEAEEQYRKALAIQEKLAAEFPAIPAYRHQLAVSNNNLSNLLYDLGKRPQAEEQYRKAMAIQEKLAAEFRAIPAYRQELAMSHNNLGNLLRGLGKRPEAEEQYRKALAIQEKLAADFPAVPDYRRSAAANHNNLGILLANLGQRLEAEEQFRKGLAIQEKLATEFPAVPAYSDELAWSHNHLGVLLRDLGKHPEAEEQYRKALAIQEKLSAEFPAVPVYREGVAANHNNLGTLLSELGKRPQAEEHYRRPWPSRRNWRPSSPPSPRTASRSAAVIATSVDW